MHWRREMDLLDLKKLALLGIAGGVLMAASGHHPVFADGQGGSGGIDKEANGCSGGNGCEGVEDDSPDDGE
ncbi:hypothetical protein wcw_1051 [Waddlia chondrophila WSU 86-1044]|uniref:Uncharacterized protein n=2 Tax=Waddlia chondrophila TaxID=71667 RepID=D6YW99_WADCW|nr:hypothetical protein wcw_1051 [Waddlia chondrophila WSU 86-1044]